MTASPTRAVILAFPETTASVLYGMYDLFLSTGRDWGMVTDGRPGPELIRPVLAARRAAPFDVANGVRVVPHTTLEDCPQSPIICVPEIYLPPDEPLAERFGEEIAWLRQCHAEGAMLAASCSGSMLLAETGLLDGWEATTHWAWCDVLRERFPQVAVRTRCALVVSGEGQRLIMAGGGTTWLDLTLYVIARAVGLEHAIQVARVNLIDWHHSGQQPFARLARTRQVEDAVIARCQSWLAENYDRRNPVGVMVRLSGLAERSFKRRFQQATGMSPLSYVHALRLEQARQLLESCDLSIDAIANEVGYEDAAFFSRLFRRKVNLTPAQYRRRFGELRDNLALRGPPDARGLSRPRPGNGAARLRASPRQAQP